MLEENGKSIAIYPSDTLSLEYEIGFQHPLIGHQKLEVKITPENYRTLDRAGPNVRFLP